MPKGMRCPDGHAPVWAKGYVPTNAGVRQRFVCSVCAITFYKPRSKPEPENILKDRVAREQRQARRKK